MQVPDLLNLLQEFNFVMLELWAIDPSDLHSAPSTGLTCDVIV